jgi:hypothetical protein
VRSFGPLRDVAIGGGWVLGIAFLVRALEGFVSNPMTAAALGAIAVSFAAGHVRVKTAPLMAGRKQLVRGLALGAIPVLAVLAVAVATGNATVATTTPTVALFYGLFEALALAFRDEFWLHGMPLVFARRAGVPRYVAIGFAASASVAFAVSTSTSWTALLTHGGVGLVCAGLWWLTEHAWAPVAAHFVWRWCTQSALAGDLLDVNFTSGGWDTGVSSFVALASFVALFAYLIRSSSRPTEADKPGASADPDRGA